MSIQFNWDETKNKSNHKKHGVLFEKAKSVFYDDNARVSYDPDHSEDENRFIILGQSKYLNILTVIHCYKDNESEIRIISARKASKNEKKQYTGYLL
jgi:uncharacterized protein